MSVNLKQYENINDRLTNINLIINSLDDLLENIDFEALSELDEAIYSTGILSGYLQALDDTGNTYHLRPMTGDYQLDANNVVKDQ